MSREGERNPRRIIEKHRVVSKLSLGSGGSAKITPTKIR